jgi:nitroreductase
MRKPEKEINKVFIERWSPRAMSAELISKEEFFSLIEAAKWAPSSKNSQPWRFLYAFRGSEEWEMFFDLLNDPNKVWATNAAVLVVMLSRKAFEQNDKPSRLHSFDAGAAWQNLALQGSLNRLAVHAMEGFDHKKARVVLDVPKTFDIEIMIAIGKQGDREMIPPHLQEREYPSDRKIINEIAMKGKFGFEQ